MNIRKLAAGDIDMLIKLRLDYMLADRGFLTAEEKTAMCLQLTEYYTKHMNQDFIAIVAEEGNNVMAAAFLVITEKPANPTFITGKTGILLNVLTYPEYRRRGLATRVISRIIDEAKELGVSSIDLLATEDGKPLYKKLGFAEPHYTLMKLQLDC